MTNLAAGTVIDGRFEITGEIGRGGFATVYSAVQRNINRPVAIKVLRTDDLGDLADNFRARFRREAESAGRIHHPGVVKIHDFGLIDAETPFVVMELLRGRDLQAELDQNGAIDTVRAFRLFLGCLDAVSAAHALDIVHKDLKPANLFLCDPGAMSESLRVTDFGIAAIVDERTERLTATGFHFGSPAYMAPEYLLDQIVSPAVDVYQMGLILVEMLCGRPVVDDPNDMACLKIHARGQLQIQPGTSTASLGPSSKARSRATPTNGSRTLARSWRRCNPSIPPTSQRWDRTIRVAPWPACSPWPARDQWTAPTRLTPTHWKPTRATRSPESQRSTPTKPRPSPRSPTGRAHLVGGSPPLGQQSSSPFCS